MIEDCSHDMHLFVKYDTLYIILNCFDEWAFSELIYNFLINLSFSLDVYVQNMSKSANVRRSVKGTSKECLSYSMAKTVI